jgi:hypothetical protein
MLVPVELEIVTVLESQDPVEIAWAKAALDEAGIDFYVAGEEIGVLPMRSAHSSCRCAGYRLPATGKQRHVPCWNR